MQPHECILWIACFFLENKINDLARKMEKQFAERAAKKPAGGISILPESKDEVQELTVRLTLWGDLSALVHNVAGSFDIIM